MKRFALTVFPLVLLCAAVSAAPPATPLRLKTDDLKRLEIFAESASSNRPWSTRLDVALKAVDRLQQGLPLDHEVEKHPLNASAEKLKQLGFLSDERYARNALTYIYKGGRIYGPSREDQEHADCVAVGAAAGSYCCTGTIIAPKLVVTAGHCYAECAKYVLIGSAVTDTNRRVIKVKKAIRHPAFGATDGAIVNDLTLLVLDEAVGLPPRKIASLETLKTAPEAWVVGFGTTSSDGRTGYGVRRIGGPLLFADESNPAFGADRDTEFVLARQPNGLDTCNGDSGGPVYVYSGGVEYVAGATSRAVPGATVACGEGGVYVKLAAFADWMREVSKKENIEAPIFE
jgi:hypothetical protein